MAAVVHPTNPMAQANDRPPTLQPVPPLPPSETLPTMYDLPSEYPEEPGLPDEFHDLQPQLLSRTLRLTQYAPDNYFTGTDINVYYDARHPTWHKRPDWFLAVDVPRLYKGQELRNSYVVWQESVNPLVVVEFLSPGTEAEDLGPFYNQSKITETIPPRKWWVYEQILRVPYYIVFSRYTGILRFFRLVGARYEEQPVDNQSPDQPQLWIPELELGLGVWQGAFDGIDHRWLRWCDRSGNWLLTDTELAAQQADVEAQRAESEAQRAESEAQRADAAEAKLQQVIKNLQQTGMDMETIANIVGLSPDQLHDLDTET